jgi:hypothetical protein
VSDNEACHKHRAVIEFLTVDQEPMGNINKGPNIFTEVPLLTEAQLDAW